ncbi:hypothetical protein [Aquamicrobium zhengzhouense]|uniref:Uncharacterized protein n=1 Tax=Aquamicrobium zhengzhouense TaxID=2781738 RepID=A0ABS0SA67_9HYPH|nr:hypothetical protein [Aquamicrobium zhengzhouense]MBI1620178.1 hypothetical protein [Aquamicrobium zhengzhouense]
MARHHDNDNELISAYLLVLARLADAMLALRDVEEVTDFKAQGARFSK